MKRTLIAVVVAGLAFAGCSGAQAPPKNDATPAAAPAAAGETAGAPAGSKAAPALLAMLPAKDQVAGWAQSREPRGFTADNLWEQIDGAADSFVTYGVGDAVFSDYKQAGTGHEAVIEIYQLKDPLNAWGKYADEIYPEAQIAKVGADGYTGSNLVNFWAGEYYVKIRSVGEKPEVKPELMKLAQAVAAKVTTPGAAPREAALFPPLNMVAHSARFIPSDVLAQSFLKNGFQAEYKAGQKTWKLLAIAQETPTAAQDALAKYRQAVSKSGKGLHALAAPGDGGFAGQDDFYGNLVAVRTRNYIVVALGVTAEDAGIKQLTEVIRNIK